MDGLGPGYIENHDAYLHGSNLFFDLHADLARHAYARQIVPPATEWKLGLGDSGHVASPKRPTASILTRVEVNVAQGSLGGELWAFMRTRKKWWLLPIMTMMLLVGALLIFAQGSALAPFIYTIF